MATSVSIQNLGDVWWNLHDVSNFAGYLGAALGVGMVVPQIVRTFRNRALAGVSVSSWALTALACMTWLLYGVRAHELPQIPGNILLSSGAAVVALAVPAVTSSRMRTLRLAGPAFVIVALAIVLPAAAIGLLAFGFGAVSSLPQVVRSLGRHRGDTSEASHASAVSVFGWLLRAASQACWLFYALVRHDAVVSISATVILASALLVVLGENRRRPRQVPALAQGATCATAALG